MKTIYSTLLLTAMIGFSGCTGASDENPTITLEGSPEITSKVGETVYEPGYSASDVKDGDITNNVRITGVVDSNKIGTYTVIYKVVDSDGNEATASRTIHITQNGAGSGQVNRPSDAIGVVPYNFTEYAYNANLLTGTKGITQTVYTYTSNGQETSKNVTFTKNANDGSIYTFYDNQIQTRDFIEVAQIKSIPSDGSGNVYFKKTIHENEVIADVTKNNFRMVCKLKNYISMPFDTATVTGSSIPTYSYSANVLLIGCERSDGYATDSYFANGYGKILEVRRQSNGDTEYEVLDKQSWGFL